ncbi:MAG: TatD family hydrolase [Deltaproteobacteria bacterium]|nr:TatD family hydrolase [Deltaproteobacteria bacterium]
MRLFDAHSHLEEIGDLVGAVGRASKAGVFAIVAVGSNLDSCKRVLEVSGDYENTTVYPALGMHPWGLKAEEVGRTLAFIEEHMDRAVGVGEIGLDYWTKAARKNPGHTNLQRDAFSRLLNLGKRFKKPVIIHCRGAWEDCPRMVMDMGVEKAVFHWFSGPLDVLDQLLDRGYLISATPAAAYSEKHQAAIARAPLERLLLETDSPVTYQGETSEPAHLAKTLEAVARIKGVEMEEVAEITTMNALKFFGLGEK